MDNLYEINKPKMIISVCSDYYKKYEKLIFRLSRADGMMTTEQFKRLSIYDFYRHKEHLEEEAIENKKRAKIKK